VKVALVVVGVGFSLACSLACLPACCLDGITGFIDIDVGGGTILSAGSQLRYELHSLGVFSQHRTNAPARQCLIAWEWNALAPVSAWYAAVLHSCASLLQGLAMNFDWYQERTKDDSSTIGGWATALGYDFGLPGTLHGCNLLVLGRHNARGRGVDSA
jgi:hypothetical protein